MTSCGFGFFDADNYRGIEWIGLPNGNVIGVDSAMKRLNFLIGLWELFDELLFVQRRRAGCRCS